MRPERARYQQRHLFEEDPNLISGKAEDHWFERKSFRIEPSALADMMIGFANADGGTLLVGVDDDGTITGVGSNPHHLNELQQAAIQHTSPMIRPATDLLPCQTSKGESDHLLVIEIPPGEQVYKNKKGDVFQRHGDQNRRLGSDEILELTFDKGQRQFDGTPAHEAALDDLDETAIAQFATQVGIPHDPHRALRVRNLLTGHDGQRRVTWGALLLFGKAPNMLLPGAHIRFLRYEGTTPQPGTRSNLTFDRRIEGPLPEQIVRAEDVMLNQLHQVTRLDEQTGRFITVPELPRFAWLEAIVNAVTHRSYSLQGDHIRVKMFDDRIEVESPGRLPGSVRIDNIRYTRFSRNPHISRALADLRLVQELNEGMNRMFEEMASAGLPEPRLQQTDAGFKVTPFNSGEAEQHQIRAIIGAVPPNFAPALDLLFAEGRITTGQVVALTDISSPTARRYLRSLADAGLIERVSKSERDPRSYWRLPVPLRRRWRPPTRPAERTY